MNMTSAEKAQMLLPWYVNGSISYDDEKLVESELAKSAALRKEYESQRSIAKRVKQDKDLLEISVISTQEQRLTKLMGRIHSESLSEENVRENTLFLAGIKKVFSNLASVPSRPWAYPAFAFLILLQLGVLVYVLQPDILSLNNSSSVFEQASTDQGVPSQKFEVIIEFTPQAKRAEIDDLLTGLNAEILYHPEGSYSYRILLNNVQDDVHLNQVLTNLQNRSQLVLFAERGF